MALLKRSQASIDGLSIKLGELAQADAALTTRIDNLGNAFNYVSTLAGGSTSAAAVDLAGLAQKDTGDYYKVSTSGWFMVGAGAPFMANANDGLVWNTLAGVDIIDNTNSTVAGTAQFISVTGSADTGFLVDIDPAFKGKVSAVETGLGDEITNRGVAITALDASLKTYADAAAAAVVVSTSVESLVVSNDRIVLAHKPKDGVNTVLNFGTVRYIDSNNIAYDAPVSIDSTDVSGKTLVIGVDTSGQWSGFTVLVQYQH